MAVKNRKVTLPTTRVAGKAKTRTASSRYDRGQRIPNQEQNLANADIQAFRSEVLPAKALRLLSRKDGVVGSAVFTYAEMANSGYTLKAFDTGTHLYSPVGTEAARTIISLLDTIYDYQRGFSDTAPIEPLLSTMLREVVLTGFLATELVLDKARLPERIVVVPFESIVWKSRGDKGTKYPVQQGTTTGGDEVSLDTATFFTSTLHEDPTRSYATPLIEPAIDSVVHLQEFLGDMRRSLRTNGHSRLVVLLDHEKISAAAPDDIRDDPEKMQVFLESQRVLVEDLMKTLEPEDSIVAYDVIGIDNVQADSVKKDYTDLLAVISGMLATSLKSHPSILGLRIAGSQALSNTESMVFIKLLRGIQRPVEAVMSRMLTLATRLYGQDVYVKFRFNPINLRPATELAAYEAMAQAGVLEKLSLGRISDEEAQEELGLGPLPPGAPKLSGTFFYQKDNTMIDDIGAPRDPQGEVLQSKMPQKAGGKSQ